MKNKTLLVMAAGMGSRFGGLKQVEPVGPNGEFIIDYSVFDAKRAGFNKVVFIIKKENYDLFKHTIGNRIENSIKVEYVFQDINNLPDGYECPSNRVKPWGTAHAILCAKDVINEKFLVINSDDFYGRDAYLVASKFLDEVDDNTNKYGLIGYQVDRTLTENGSVKRGVCLSKDNYVTNIIESLIECNDSNIVASPLDGSKSFKIDNNQLVSMNMFCLTKEIFKYLDDNFPKFLDNNKNNILECEYLIPQLVADSISNNISTVKLLKTSSKWLGITYKEDKQKLVDEINKMIEQKIYPKELF